MRRILVVLVSIVAVVCIAEGVRLLWKARGIESYNRCWSNLALIDAAKAQWAVNNEKSGSDTPSWADLRPYFPDTWTNGMPICPKGGKYTIGQVNQLPRCSIGGPDHSLLNGTAARVGEGGK